MSNKWTSSIAFVSVLAIHAGAIGLAIWAPSPKTEELTLPTVQGMLIPAPPAETVQVPSAKPTPPPIEPPPPEPEKPKPKPKKPEPKPKPKPEPLPEAPPSEKAITQEEAPPKEESAPPPPVATPTAEENDSMGAPVTPPREDAREFNNPRPAYPRFARERKQQGTVLLEILILPDGTVGEVKIRESSGFKLLDNTAVKAVKRWKYIPAKRGDEPIAYWYLQPLEFTLH